MASSGILNSVWSSIGLKPTKPPDYISDDSCSSRSPIQMVETTHQIHTNRTSVITGTRMSTSSSSSPPLSSSSTQPPSNSQTINFSQHQNNYLTTAMLLGTQGCNYLGQRLSALDSENTSTNNHHNHLHHHHQRNGTNPSSLFTIDSILAPKPNNLSNNITRQKSESPCNNSMSPTQQSPVRPTRVPAMLHHPGLHLGHLAAAAASSFGTTSDFLGEFYFCYILSE